MKRSLFSISLKHSLLAVPAAALMLGSAHGGSTVGLNFQDWYYQSGGAGYQTTGMPVTADAFGVAVGNWFSSPPLSCNSWDDPAAAPIDTSVPFGGTLAAQVRAPAAWQSAIGLTTAAWEPVTVTPGNDEVTWGYIGSGYGGAGVDGQAPSVTVSSLAAKFPNGYVVQTIAAHQGNAAFNDVDFTDGVTTSTSAYSTYYVKGPVTDGFGYGSGTVGLSAPSAVFTNDTIDINPQLQTAGSYSLMAGFIITDQTVISRNPVGGVFVQANPFSLSAGAVGIPPLAYQWRTNGVAIPGATSENYSNPSANAADAGSYDVVVTNLYGAATSGVAVVTIVVAHPAQTVTWDADPATTGAQDGDGSWNFSPPHWWDGASDSTWWTNDTAIFGVGGAGPYTVTLGASISANAITFNGGSYTITNTSGESLTLHDAAAITANAAATIGAPISTGTNSLLKDGTGPLTLSGAMQSARTIVSAGSLEVLAKNGDSPYVVTNGTTLKIGYSTGGGYANTGMQLYGDGTAATSGLYLKGGITYNVSGTPTLLGAPTTIRHYGTGMASFGIFDINSTGLYCSAPASGSIIDANIQMVNGGYGMAAQVDAGANTATGDLILNGPLSVNAANGVYGLVKRGGGSVRLNAAATASNCQLDLRAGSAICGIANCIGPNARLNVRAGGTIDLNGFNQTVTNATLADGATIKMTINTGGTPSGTVLTTTDAGNPLTFGGTLSVASIGAAPTVGQKFTLFSSAGGYAGGFVNFILPPFDRLAWDTSQLLVDGSITVVAGSVAPSITTDLPAGTSYAYVGANFTMSVVAAGDPLLHYQWMKNGTTPVGTDSPTLTLSSVTTSDTGDYSVTVTNPWGSSPASTAHHLTVVASSPYSAAVIQDAPLTYYPLNEAEPSTAYDYSGNGHDGTQNGIFALGAAGPRPPTYAGFTTTNTAYQFDGSSTFIDCGTGAALTGTTDFTLEAWINTTSTLVSGVIIQQRYSGGFNGEYIFAVNADGTLSFTVYGGGGYQFNNMSSTMLVNDGQWHHVAAVRSGANGALYIDGTLAASASGTVRPLDSTFTVAIGSDIRNGTTFFNGLMCDVAIYNKALSASTLQTHYTVGQTGTVTAPQFNPPVLSNGQVIISWTGTGTLLQSTNVAMPLGQWTIVPGNPTSPYPVNPATAGQRWFYRLQQ